MLYFIIPENPKIGDLYVDWEITICYVYNGKEWEIVESKWFETDDAGLPLEGVYLWRSDESYEADLDKITIRDGKAYDKNNSRRFITGGQWCRIDLGEDHKCLC